MRSSLIVSTSVIWLCHAPWAFGQPAPLSPTGTAESPAVQRASLSSQIESLFVSAARDRGLALSPDPALAAAAADLGQALADSRSPPANDLVAEALALRQVVEPAPHMVISQFLPGSQASLLADLRLRVPEIIATGRWRRVGVAVSDAPDGKQRLVALLLESWIDLLPLPRVIPAGGSTTIAGQILPPFGQPEVLVTDPAGQVARVPINLSPRPGAAKSPDVGAPFWGLFRCTATGRFQVEVLGQERGPTVLANFPLYCGVPAPTHITVESARPQLPPYNNAAEAEQQLFALLQADRSRAGLPRLTWDPGLQKVARAHSLDMRDHNFLAHSSPTTGDASARLKRAGILTSALLENLGRAYSPQEVEQGLMDSPGHRANILSPDVTHAAIGVQLRTLPGGLRELWVTQLFMRPRQALDVGRAPQQVHDRIAALRDQAGAAALQDDAVLRDVATRIATGLGDGSLSEDRVGEPAQRAMQQLTGRFRSLRTVLAVSSDPRNLGQNPSLVDPTATHLGIAVAPQRNNRELVHVVIVLGYADRGEKSEKMRGGKKGG